MKKLVALVLALLLGALTLASCGSSAVDISGARSLADLAGARISAQGGTFHEDALAQLPAGTVTSVYKEFDDMLVAVNAGVIDGYIAEEPTALTVCLKDKNLDYIRLTNNDTGFTATAEDVGIAVGLKKGSEDLKNRINAILAEIPQETRMTLMEQMVRVRAGETVGEYALKSERPASPNGVFVVAMECAYEPFNWTEIGKKTEGAVAITGEGKDNLYANGYDVRIAQYIADKLGMTLEIRSEKWDNLVPSLNAGSVTAIIAGMSSTADRQKEVDFTDVYYSSNLVIVYKKSR